MSTIKFEVWVDAGDGWYLHNTYSNEEEAEAKCESLNFMSEDGWSWYSFIKEVSHD